MFYKAQVPVLRLFIPFVIGIVLAIYMQYAAWWMYAITGTAWLLFVLLLFYKKAFRYKLYTTQGMAIHLLFFGLGYVYTISRTDFQKTSYIAHTPLHEQGIILGEVKEPPQVKVHSSKVLIEVKGIRNGKEWESSSGNVVLYIKTDSASMRIRPGDYLSFMPKLEDVPAPKNPEEFDFRQYMSFHLVQKQAFLRSHEWKLLPQDRPSHLRRFASGLRNKLIHIFYTHGIRDRELAVVSALVLGYKDDIDKQLKRSYSSAGAMHVLAVSGLHVGIIFILVSRLFFFLQHRKYGKYILLLLLLASLWFYALLTGLSPSVLRAATMFSFVSVGKTFSRNTSFFNTLAVSAFFLLLVNPYMIMEVGFQLSYLAVIGIVVFYPWFYELFTFRYKIPDYIWSITSVSLAAQLVTFPLSLLYFHQFPSYFLLSNLVVIPLATIILPAGIALFLFALYPPLASLLATGMQYLLSFLNAFVNEVENLPYALLQNIPFTIFETWMMYAAMFFIICFAWYKRPVYVAVCLCCIIASLSYRVAEKAGYKKNAKLLVYQVPGHTAVNIIYQSNNVLISDEKLYTNREKMLFHMQNNWIKHGLKNENVVYTHMLQSPYQLSALYRLSGTGVYANKGFVSMLGKKLYLLNHTLPPEPPDTPIALDFVIATRHANMDFSRFQAYFDCPVLILDASVSPVRSEQIDRQVKEVQVHAVSREGYFLAAL